MSRLHLTTATLCVTLAAVGCRDAAPTEVPAAAPRDSTPAVAGPTEAATGVRRGTGIRRSVAAASAGAAASCPPYSFVTQVNHAANPSFEVGPGHATWPPGASPIPSAATGWHMHTRDAGAPITTDRVATTAPGPAGQRMLAVRATSTEAGVYQVRNTPAKVMFSVWVRVAAGRVVIGANAMVGMTPYSWSTKLNEWEQLRVCTDGTNPTGYFYVYNQDPRGGTFYVDRAEIREIP